MYGGVASKDTVQYRAKNICIMVYISEFEQQNKYMHRTLKLCKVKIFLKCYCVYCLEAWHNVRLLYSELK